MELSIFESSVYGLDELIASHPTSELHSVLEEQKWREREGRNGFVLSLQMFQILDGFGLLKRKDPVFGRIWSFKGEEIGFHIPSLLFHQSKSQ